jgi:hypothetical protein
MEVKSMNTNLILRSTIAVVALMASAGPAAAGGSGVGHANAPWILKGTWVVAITPYECSTGESFLTVIKAFQTFDGSGTMVETTSGPTFQPGQRSPGLGYWERAGQGSYRAVFEAFVLFDSVNPSPYMPDYKRGTQRFDQGIVMLDADHWASDAVVTFKDTAGAVVPPSNCARVAAERMQ